MKRLLVLKEAQQLYFGADSLLEGFGGLVYLSTYIPQFEEIGIQVMQVSVALILVTGLIYIVLKKKFNSPLFLLFILITFLLGGLTIEHLIFDAKFPKGRTALFYVPIIALFTYLLIKELVEEFEIKRHFYLPVLLCISAPVIINLAASLNFTSAKTWQYDAHTKEVMLFVKHETDGNAQKSKNEQRLGFSAEHELLHQALGHESLSSE